jgi:iron-sulfur cluster assembly protein
LDRVSKSDGAGDDAGSGESDMITITEIAREKIAEVAEAQGRKGDGLRILVRHGGTPAVEFGLNFVGEKDAREDDTVLELEGLTVYVDPQTEPFLEGATVDFVEQGHHSGFKVDAPKAVRSGPADPSRTRSRRSSRSASTRRSRAMAAGSRSRPSRTTSPTCGSAAAARGAG